MGQLRRSINWTPQLSTCQSCFLPVCRHCQTISLSLLFYMLLLLLSTCPRLLWPSFYCLCRISNLPYLVLFFPCSFPCLINVCLLSVCVRGGVWVCVILHMNLSLLRMMYNVVVLRGTERHSGTPGCNWCVFIILESQPETCWVHMKRRTMENLCHFFSCLQKCALHKRAIPQHYFLKNGFWKVAIFERHHQSVWSFLMV